MDATNQPPKPYPPAPTVEDESDSTPHNTANMDRDMPDAPQAPTVPADTPQANATPDKNTTTGEAAAADSSTNPAEPRTPANKDPAELPSDRVQIVLKDQGGNQIAFGVKSSTRMEKVQNAYAEKAGRPLASLRFYYEGARVLPDDTVATLEMENEDIIEVMAEQIGGNDDSEVTLSQPEGYIAKHSPGDFPDDTEVAFVVNGLKMNGKIIRKMEYVIGPDVKIKHFMESWAKRAGCNLDDVVFRYNPDKEGPVLPFGDDNDTFGTDFIPGDAVFVSAAADEPINLARPREEFSRKNSGAIMVGPKVPGGMIEIILKYFDATFWARSVYEMGVHTCFGKLVARHSIDNGYDASTQRLIFGGMTLLDDDSPASIGVKHGATLYISKAPKRILP